MRKGKPRQGKGYLSRKINIQDEIPTFLIVCEGERTEPNYFRSFRVPTIRIEVKGLGFNTISLVEAAIMEKANHEYDQTWCVFDRDSFPAENFNRAIFLAKEHDIKVAYSNEAFELWYLLHYHYYDTAIGRKEYCKRLTDLMGMEYKKNHPDIYRLLENRQASAIRNAEKLLTQYNPPRAEKDNPSTTVHLLVQELNRFARG